MAAALIILEMLAIIAGLVAAVGALFYAFCWLLLLALRLVPIIGKRHRHPRWDELTSRSGRR